MSKHRKEQNRKLIKVNHDGSYDTMRSINKLLAEGYKIESMEGAKDFVLVYLVRRDS